MVRKCLRCGRRLKQKYFKLCIHCQKELKRQRKEQKKLSKELKDKLRKKKYPLLEIVGDMLKRERR